MLGVCLLVPAGRSWTAATQQGRDGDRCHQDTSVEDRGDPRFQAQQWEPEDAGRQEVDTDEGTDRVGVAAL
jgi:hypothetical protein